MSNTKDNPPCNTLFVGNLGDTVSEAELRQLFGTLAGFRQLKLIRGARSVTCFVEFSDLPSAMACHQNQQVTQPLACYPSAFEVYRVVLGLFKSFELLRGTVWLLIARGLC